MACWNERGGCDPEMRATCPHSLDGERCPTRCRFAECDRPSHKLTSDPSLIFSADVDRSAAVKDACEFCEFFLTHGPRAAL